MSRDDDRLANASRALRLRLGLTQDSLVGTGRSRHIPRLIENGGAGELRLKDVRDHFSRLGGSVRVNAWYDGALLDRLVDSEHADVVEHAVSQIVGPNWQGVHTEVSFNEYGDRGSIDFLAANEVERAVLIGEAKSAWGALGETLRSLDIKVRLAPKIATDRYGWQPRVVGVVLALPESSSSRRVAQRYSTTLLNAFPARNIEIQRLLRSPHQPLRGLWFLPIGAWAIAQPAELPQRRPICPNLRPSGRVSIQRAGFRDRAALAGMRQRPVGWYGPRRSPSRSSATRCRRPRNRTRGASAAGACRRRPSRNSVPR